VHMLTLVADISQLIFTIMEDPSDSEENYKRPNMYLIKVMEMRVSFYFFFIFIFIFNLRN